MILTLQAIIWTWVEKLDIGRKFSQEKQMDTVTLSSQIRVVSPFRGCLAMPGEFWLSQQGQEREDATGI